MRTNLIQRSIQLVLLVSFSVSHIPISGQMIIWTEDFEDHGNSANGGSGRYTSSNDFMDIGADDDYFGRVEGTTSEFWLTDVTSNASIHSVVGYSGWHGDFYYAAEDLDDTGGTVGSPDGLDYKDVTFTGLSIDGGTNLEFKGLFAAGENDGCGASIYDDSDFVEIYYNVDNSGEVLALCFNPDLECNIPDDITNEPLYQDPNCDGDGGEGTLLTAAFAEFGFDIPEGNVLDIRIRVQMDAGSEEFAFDYFRVYSDTPIADPCPSELSVDDTPITSGTYQAVTKLTSMGIVGAGSNVVFVSGDHVMLNPNFEVLLTGIFEINIQGCN